ncbi:U11/U12 small nuclear ribonucleoprotein 25 kDa protein [Physcomitrium patens]|uniref:SNRNP25 ubiquitin-like domain-containing protein n=2 Tax=Physcomitrium patens TaxID=3218 RepID=A9SRN9_PHYPA|nr:U11/U12 small nuclear ribonucleoprotein 25 kDa protein-like [Physcomitrium patens]|eukprot:XP_024356682.1 U11/U12 small nuclear ribonucleoprotein 25 kDa protein-like [Physcomitrella patens]
MMLGVRRGDMGTYFKRSQFKPLVSSFREDPVGTAGTVAKVDSLIGVELGTSMKLSILKLDGSHFDVVVLTNSRVRDLKQAVVKYVDHLEQSELGHKRISWQHVWGHFCLCHGTEKLVDDDARLAGFGIRNNDQLRFEHHVSLRDEGQYLRAKKRRFFHGLIKTDRKTPASTASFS